MYRKTLFLVLPAALVTTLLSVAGCSFARQSVAVLRSTNHFIPNEHDSRVLFEPGAEGVADKVAALLPAAVMQVEQGHYRRFADPVRVYVCASRKSFRKHYGADVRAGVLTKLFLSPRVFEFGDEIAKKYLTHELSHLHLQQLLGVYKTSRLPMWFKEGLAASVSDGGGAHLVTPEQAIASIRAGSHFVPNKSDGFIFKTTPDDFGLEPHMFYRQSMMFIRYLSEINEPAFRTLLLSIENGVPLSSALQTTYNKNLEEVWNEFLSEVKSRDVARAVL